MYLPSLTTTKQSRDSIAQFNGLCKTNECADSEMRHMHNMSLKDYPYLSSRKLRNIFTSCTGAKGILGGETLYIVTTTGISVIDKTGQSTAISASFTDTPKKLVKMGSYLCIFPDKKVFDGTSVSTMYRTRTATSVTLKLRDANNSDITYHDAAYYETHTPQDGDYLLSNVGGVDELQKYSSTSGMWFVVTTTYISANATSLTSGLDDGDGVKISINLGETTVTTEVLNEIKRIFPLTEADGTTYYTNCTMKKISGTRLAFVGLLKMSISLSNITFKVERIVPDIAYVTEANNRLWGCNAAGTELYACKLGDPKNWNCFEGISTDSWAATVGSDGEFTGAITYLGYPTFFKENSLIKIAISSNGAHITKETVCRGVQKGCGESLCVVNEILYYKAQTAICAYDGSLPQTISKKLGDMSEYTTAIGGRNKECYYIQCSDSTDTDIFVYDTLKGAWVEDDHTHYTALATWNNILVGANPNNNKIELFDDYLNFTVTEPSIIWRCVTKNFDYQVVGSQATAGVTDTKYIHRIIIKAHMDVRALARVWIRYDDGMYERLFEMRSVGTKTYPLTIIPHRCDRFAIMIEGEGDVQIQAITKYLETGSDVY